MQADTYGIAISRVLRIQAKVMRVKRRQRAEEKAMKLPVTILFPLLFFIFPVLFIAILGPAVINAIATFSGHYPERTAPRRHPAGTPPKDR